MGTEQLNQNGFWCQSSCANIWNFRFLHVFFSCSLVWQNCFHLFSHGLRKMIMEPRHVRAPSYFLFLQLRRQSEKNHYSSDISIQETKTSCDNFPLNWCVNVTHIRHGSHDITDFQRSQHKRKYWNQVIPISSANISVTNSLISSSIIFSEYRIIFTWIKTTGIS